MYKSCYMYQQFYANKRKYIKTSMYVKKRTVVNLFLPPCVRTYLKAKIH